MICFRLRRFDFHLIGSLYASDYDSDSDSVASENQPLVLHFASPYCARFSGHQRAHMSTCAYKTQEISLKLMMQFLWRESCNFKIARVNQVRFSVRFVAAISQGFRTCLKLDATSARQKLHRVAVTKIACINGPLRG